MAKGQKRSNREVKKPKQPKKAAAAAASFLGTPARSAGPMPGKKK